MLGRDRPEAVPRVRVDQCRVAGKCRERTLEGLVFAPSLCSDGDGGFAAHGAARIGEGDEDTISP
jgi:hypothetical protein